MFRYFMSSRADSARYSCSIIICGILFLVLGCSNERLTVNVIGTLPGSWEIGCQPLGIDSGSFERKFTFTGNEFRIEQITHATTQCDLATKTEVATGTFETEDLGNSYVRITFAPTEIKIALHGDALIERAVRRQWGERLEWKKDTFYDAFEFNIDHTLYPSRDSSAQVTVHYERGGLAFADPETSVGALLNSEFEKSTAEEQHYLKIAGPNGAQ